MAGRRPKPTRLKKVLGNPGHRKLNQAEPQPAGAARKPKFLKARAAKLWDEYAPELIRLGILTSVDAHSFAAWCCLAAEFERSRGLMQAARISQMRSLASAFGMDASARARLSVKNGDGNQQDPAEKYFAEPNGPGHSVLQ